MTIRSRAIFTFLVIFACIGCDQETKSIARQEIPASKPITKMGQMLQLQYTENSGALLGVGSGLPAPVRFWLFIVFAGAALTAILAFTLMDKKLRKPGIFALSLVLGGGLSNLADRLFKGGIVVDFMKLTLGPVETAIFNLADVMIIVGFVLFLVSNLPWSALPERRANNC
jgi:signal peptidase II